MKHPRGSDRHKGRPAVWATLTIASFPLVALATSWMGFDPFRSFLFGACASTVIILLEGAVRGRWWFSEPIFAQHLGHPSFGQRMLVVLGLLIVVFQTFILTAFLTQKTLDSNIVLFVLKRQCAAPQGAFLARICTSVTSPSTRMDAASLAIREAAEKRFFANGFVTCSVRTLANTQTPLTCTQTSLVRCDRWMVGKVAGIPVSLESKERAVTAAMTMQDDGTYRVDGWNEDSTTAEWSALGGADAATLNDALLRARPSMAAETFRRAMERLYAR